MSKWLSNGAGLAVLVVLASPAAAREVAREGASPVFGSQRTAQESSEPHPGEVVDLADLIRKLRHKDPPAEPADDGRRMQAIAPVIGTKPSSGIIFGVAGNVAFYRGDPATTRISSSVASITVTTKKQAGIGARTTMFGGDDRWRLEADYRFQWTSQDTFGLGVDTARGAGEMVRFDFYRLHQSAYVQVAPDLYVGGGLHFDSHTNVEPGDEADASWPDSAYVQYSLLHGLPADSQISAGPSVEVMWDTRDSFINADHGWLARLNYRVLIDGFLGGDSHWDKVNLDLRTYRRLSKSGRHKLAVWAYADLVVDGVAPYLDLPSTASDTYGRSGRGYAEGHFRGEQLAFLELEYRAPLTRNGLLGWVAFLNATTISNRDAGERLFDHAAPGGGVGLRLLLNKRSKTNLAFDVAMGERGNRGIYLAVQEAF